MALPAERNPSLWIETARSKTYRPLEGKPSFDAIVIGAGITGLTTALLLQREGMHVGVLEARRVGGGVTGYTTAKVTALQGVVLSELLGKHGEERAREYADANVAAVDRIVAIVQEEEIDCDLERMDAYTFAATPSESSLISEEARACETLGVKAALETEPPVPFPVSAAVALREQAMFHPRKYCLGLAERIHGRKGKVYEASNVLEVEEKKTVCKVKTENGTISAPFVVVATHLPFMGEGKYYAKTAPYRSYAMAVRLRGDHPDGMFISASQPIRSLRPYSSGRKRWTIVGGESHKVGQEEDTTVHYEALERWARENLDVEEIDYRWSAQDYLPADGMPYVGRLTKDNERVFVATGFRKWGMTNGTAAAMMITDAISGRDNPWAEAFDSTRVRPKQAAKEFVKENLNVASKLVGGKITTSVGSPADVSPGQAAVLIVGGESLAMFRDEKGTLHSVAAECTHMGCRVAWNTAERSWDCPCHGSRFDPDGAVLEGPANQALKKKKPSREKLRAT